MPPHDQDRASPTARVVAEAARDAVAAPSSPVERSRAEFVVADLADAVEHLGVAVADINEKFSRMAAGEKYAETSLLNDIDSVLSRLDSGIERERQAMDLLLNRIHSPAS
jgi:hypothetical protein